MIIHPPLSNTDLEWLQGSPPPLLTTLYHGTDQKGYEEILKRGTVNPIYSESYNTRIVNINGIDYRPDGVGISQNAKEKLNPFFMTTDKEYARMYGNVVLSIKPRKIKTIYLGGISKLEVPRIFGKEIIIRIEVFTYDVIPLQEFNVEFLEKLKYGNGQIAG